MTRMSTAQRAAVDRGWSAADVGERELVDDAWITANTSPGLPPSTARAVGGRLLSAVRTFGVDPLDGLEADAAAEFHGITRKLPRMARKYGLQSGGFTRDQMRRIAARTGYPYVEAWSSRTDGGAMKGVKGALIHHTGSSWSAPGDYPTLKVVQNGRADLQNSLCAFGLGRSGTIYLVSPLLSWHAGAGNINGVTDGNGWLVGIEAESDGVNWTDAERDAYPRLVASILIEIGADDKYTTRHATYALPQGRKTDALGLDMDRFWREVYAYLADPASVTYSGAPIVSPVITPTPAPAPAPVGPVLDRSTTFPLPAGHYYGLLSGPAESHGGANATEKAYVKLLQQCLQAAGFAPAGAGWADGVFGQPTQAAVTAWQHAKMPGTTRFGEVWADDWRVLVNGAAAPAPAPAARTQLPAWNLPAGHYYGLITGPAKSHGGATAAERTVVQLIQRRLQELGYAPAGAGWADGRFEQATKDAVTRFQKALMPGTTRFGEVWTDDYARLAR